MLSLVVGILFVLGALFMINAAMGSHRNQKQRSAGNFDSVAPSVGFHAREINPKPPGSLAGAVESNIPIVSAFGKAASGMGSSGMSGVWDGVAISVWEQIEDDSRRRTYYSARIEIQGPPFVIRKGKKLGAFPGERNPRDKEPPGVDVGQGEFAKSFPVRGDDEQGLRAYLTEPLQRAISDLARDWTYVEISNYEIYLGVRAPFSGDLQEVQHRLGTIASLARTMSGLGS